MEIQVTEQQKIAVREEFARRRRNQLIATVPAIAAAVGLGIAGSAGAAIGNTVHGLAIAGILGVVAFALRNWRCPACDRYLGRSFNPRYCSNCGAELR